MAKDREHRLLAPAGSVDAAAKQRGLQPSAGKTGARAIAAATGREGSMDNQRLAACCSTRRAGGGAATFAARLSTGQVVRRYGPRHGADHFGRSRRLS